jgi:membrane protein required for colicin V production
MAEMAGLEMAGLGLGPIDFLALAILVIAALRGLSLGLIREAFSLGALAAAVVAVRVWNEPFTHWVQNATRGMLPFDLAPWIAGGFLALGVIAAVGIFGRVMRQGARAVGLGFFDRLAGAALGAAEGALAAGVLLFVIGGVLGRDHALLQGSRSFALLERAERVVAAAPRLTPDVAAPPRQR